MIHDQLEIAVYLQIPCSLLVTDQVDLCIVVDT